MTSEEFTTIFLHYKAMIYNYCNRRLGNTHDAEDITHETFITFWNNRDNIELSTADRYLIRVAVNKCTDLERYKRIRTRAINTHLIDYADIINKIEQSNTIYEIYKIINNLHTRQKQLIMMRYFEEREPQNISLLLKLKRSTVRNQLVTALSHMRKEIKNRGIHLG